MKRQEGVFLSADDFIRSSQNEVKRARSWLHRSAVTWFIVACIGQWIFVYYIAAHYGGAVKHGDTEKYNSMTIAGHVEGDILGNLIFAVHVLLAATITLGGTLQLIPQIRKKVPSFHRWNGRFFIASALIMAIGGIYLVWIRGATLTTFGGLAIIPNSILIIWFSVTALLRARERKIASHQRWALRAFIAVNGAWFFRIGFMAWILINRKPVGSTDKLDGPFDLVWAFANYLLPLLILELYLRARESSRSGIKYAMTIVLFLCAMITAIGIFGAYLMLWEPHF